MRRTACLVRVPSGSSILVSIRERKTLFSFSHFDSRFKSKLENPLFPFFPLETKAKKRRNKNQITAPIFVSFQLISSLLITERTWKASQNAFRFPSTVFSLQSESRKLAEEKRRRRGSTFKIKHRKIE